MIEKPLIQFRFLNNVNETIWSLLNLLAQLPIQRERGVGGRSEGGRPIKGDLVEKASEGEGFPCSALDCPLGLDLLSHVPPTSPHPWHSAETRGSQAGFGVQIFFYLWETTTCDYISNHTSDQTALAIQSPITHRNVGHPG